MSNLICKITKKKRDGADSWEGTVTLPNVAPTKLIKTKTRESTFSTRAQVVSAAERFAQKFGFDGVSIDEGQSRAKAAAKSIKAKSSKSEKPASECSSSTCCSMSS